MNNFINQDFVWLYSWYHSQCNGDWEHGNGIEIRTLDNPGWFIRISLEETELEEKQFEKIRIDKTEDNWIRCFVEDRQFQGTGGPFNLPEILKIFREWAEQKDT